MLLVAVTGCSSNRVETHSGHAAPTSTLTQTSSISTVDAGKTPMTAKQIPNVPSQPAANPTGFAQQVLDLVNRERTNAGLKSLSMNASLSGVAMAKAQDMYNNNYFDHQSPTYGSPFDMMKKFGISYNSAGENIAKGQTSPTEVMNQWMSSPDHRANILNGNYTQIGIAYYNGQWVQEFTG
nr:CAP domain-containing protein [Paenibacillus sp. CECT 9249]